MNKIKILFYILIFLIISGCSKKELKEYKKDINYFDSNITVKLYTSSKDKADNTFDYIEGIYKKYGSLLDKYNSDSEISYIYNNEDNDKKIKLSEDMANLIEYGLKLYSDSNHVLNIFNDMDKVKLKNNVLDNNHIEIDFDKYIKGYINKLIKEYLERVHIDYYFINTGSEIIVGKNVNNEDYIVGIANPFNDDMLKVFKIQNKYISIKSIYHDQYNNNEMVSVVVMGDDIYNTELAANLLFINDYYDGKEIAKKYNVDVIWCYKDNKGNEVIKSNME